MIHSFRRAVERARRCGDLFFAALLSEDRIRDAMGDARGLWRGWIYTPAATVWVFLSQCLASARIIPAGTRSRGTLHGVSPVA